MPVSEGGFKEFAVLRAVHQFIENQFAENVATERSPER
jgi:hypothetical protein